MMLMMMIMMMLMMMMMMMMGGGQEFPISWQIGEPEKKQRRLEMQEICFFTGGRAV